MRMLIEALIIVFVMLGTAWADEITVVVGYPTAAPPSCNAATNEIGDRTEHDESQTLNGDVIRCLLYTADCSGTLAYPYIYHYGTQDDNAKLCAYSDDGDSLPDAGDTLLGCSGVIASGGSAGWKTDSTDITDAVTNSSAYWVCHIADTATDWAALHDSDTGTRSLYSKSLGGSYASPPGDLDYVWTETTTEDYSWYIAIE